MKQRLLFSIILLMVLIFSAALSFTTVKASAITEPPTVVTVKLEGPLTPIWKDILQRGIDLAARDHAQAIIVELNTTGGSIDLMNQLVGQVLDAETPVIVYVTPDGGMAASAGTLIVLAGDMAAMSPKSIIGAASPVGTQGEDIATTEAAKIKEATKATARSLAVNRGAAAIALAEAAIDNAKAASSQEALQAGLIDVIASDRTDLLNQLDGRVVTKHGVQHTLQLKDAVVIETPITLVENVLALLTNPNILFILLAIGVQAILIEFSHPGAWVPGFTGAVLLALSIYGLGLLPVNWLGLIFIILAFVLFVLDIKAPTHGALTITGTASFIAGGLILFNSAGIPSYANVSVWLVVGWGLFLGASFFGILMLAVRALKRPVITGAESMPEREGYALSDIKRDGVVSINGEHWSAVLAPGSAPVKKDDRVVVIAVRGVKMVVKKKE